MFQRQWFSPNKQIGLGQEAKAFESLLKAKLYNEALDICKSSRSHPDRSTYWNRQLCRLAHMRELNQCATLSSNLRKVYFSSFWPGFDFYNNQILDTLNFFFSGQLVLEGVEAPELSDIIIESCYGPPCKALHATKILFLGENVRPNYSDYDYSISFDLHHYGGRNTYFPLWLFEVDLFGRKYSDRCPFPLNEFVEAKLVNYSYRHNDIVYIGNNAEPFREYILSTLVDAGFSVKRYGSHYNPIEDKSKILGSSKLTLCFENTLHPGYITEKPFHALLAGCHALYWGGWKNNSFKNNSFIYNMAKNVDENEMVQFADRVLHKDSIYVCPQIVSKIELANQFKLIRLLCRNLVLLYTTSVDRHIRI